MVHQTRWCETASRKEWGDSRTKQGSWGELPTSKEKAWRNTLHWTSGFEKSGPISFVAQSWRFFQQSGGIAWHGVQVLNCYNGKKQRPNVGQSPVKTACNSSVLLSANQQCIDPHAGTSQDTSDGHLAATLLTTQQKSKAESSTSHDVVNFGCWLSFNNKEVSPRASVHMCRAREPPKLFQNYETLQQQKVVLLHGRWILLLLNAIQGTSDSPSITLAYWGNSSGHRQSPTKTGPIDAL